jgi:hypothetical protein
MIISLLTQLLLVFNRHFAAFRTFGLLLPMYLPKKPDKPNKSSIGLVDTRDSGVIRGVTM